MSGERQKKNYETIIDPVTLRNYILHERHRTFISEEVFNRLQKENNMVKFSNICGEILDNLEREEFEKNNEYYLLKVLLLNFMNLISFLSGRLEESLRKLLKELTNDITILFLNIESKLSKDYENKHNESKKELLGKFLQAEEDREMPALSFLKGHFEVQRDNSFGFLLREEQMHLFLRNDNTIINNFYGDLRDITTIYSDYENFKRDSIQLFDEENNVDLGDRRFSIHHFTESFSFSILFVTVETGGRKKILSASNSNLVGVRLAS